MSTPETSSTNTLKETPISSKFYQNLIVPSDPVVKPITNKSYKVIHNDGIMKNTTKHWDELNQLNKTPNRELFEARIKNFDRSCCQILIGATTFECHQTVLHCYSTYFTDLEIIKGEPINLPASEVNPVAFVKIYEWMLTTAQVERNGIIELYKAAKFLKIKELERQILICFDHCEVFYEDTAFSLYWEARTFNETDIQKLMLIRIQKFFLTLVATNQFLELTCKEVCSFLSSNSIGVRKESDVFYSALKWLDHNWEDRKGNAIELMGCVRFSLMLPWELTDLRTNNKSLVVQKVTEIPEVLEMIDTANRLIAFLVSFHKNIHCFSSFQDLLPQVSGHPQDMMMNLRFYRKS